MPKSKRAKIVSLTKTDKKNKENKSKLMDEIKENAQKWKYVWVFDVGEMRNAALKDVRKAWKGTGRMFFGRVRVMAKALGTTEEEEVRPGLHVLSEKLEGPVGLFFSDHDPKETVEWFEDFQKPDFARSGNKASKTVILPEGPIVQYNDTDSPFPHSMEPQLRKLGLTTSLVRGVPSLTAPHVVCTKGDVLTSEQAQLLKLIGEMMAVFRVRLRARWSEQDGVEVFEVPAGEEVSAGTAVDDEDAMSDHDL